MSQHKVIFTPSGIRATAAPGESVYDVALAAGVDMQSICGGQGLCGRCQIELQPGEYAKFAVTVAEDHLAPFTDSETRALSRGRLAPGRRLACRAGICGDVVIDVPASSQAHAMSISKASTGFTTALAPAVQLHMVQLPRPELDDNPSDAESLIAALAALGITARVDPQVLPKLQPLLAANDRELIAVVRDGTLVVDLWAPSGDHAYGAALDIGSTSLALYIYNLDSGDLVHQAATMNPQIRYGEDVMSRVSYVMMNKGGEALLTAEIRKGVAAMIADGVSALGISAAQVLELVVVGNPIMHHLFLGINPVELGQAPFTLAVKDWVEMPAGGFDMGLPPPARVQMLPLIGGHVGADTTGAYLTQIDRMAGRSVLLVDIGTNAEIVLTHGGRVAACSSPTGPAFEGAEISSGVRACPGAIERVRIDPATGAVRVRLIGSEDWVADTDDLSAVRIAGICGSGIFEVMVELASAGFLEPSGLFRPEAAPHRFEPDGEDGRSWKYLLLPRPDAPIYITQRDVRAVQLAKAALAAGAQLLIDHLGCDTLDEVLLAGAFGTHLDPAYVADIGIVPGARAEQITIIGNAAGMGAAMCLTNVAEKARIIEGVRHIEKVETAIAPAFQDYFVAGMPFPTAPAVAGGETSGRGRRNRNRDK